MKKHIFIMIRYSVLTKSQNSWDIGREVDFEVYKEKLFSPGRLELHENLFENVTFPSLCEMDERSVTALIFISDELPAVNKERLLRVVDKKSNLKVVEVSRSERVVGKMNSELFKELSAFGSDVCYATVRLDDDDALADNFENELWNYVSPEFSGHAVTFSQGYNAFYDIDGYTGFQFVKYPLIALGLSYIDVFRSGDKEVKSVYSLGKHTTIDERYPVILKSKLPMYVRTIHKASDIYHRKFKGKNGLASGLVKLNDVAECFSFLRVNPSLVNCSESQFVDIEGVKGGLLTFHNTFLCFSVDTNVFLHLEASEIEKRKEVFLVRYNFSDNSLFVIGLSGCLSFSSDGKAFLVDQAASSNAKISSAGKGVSISTKDTNQFLAPLKNGKTTLVAHCKSWEVYSLV